METRQQWLAAFRHSGSALAAAITIAELDNLRLRTALARDPEAAIRHRWGAAAWHAVLRFVDCQEAVGPDAAPRLQCLA